MAKIQLKAGGRYRSAVCDTQVMVIKAPGGEFALACGGVDMIAPTATGGGEIDSAFAGETLIGKRYVNADESLELLCTKGGKSALSFDGQKLDVKQAKQLPSSD